MLKKSISITLILAFVVTTLGPCPKAGADILGLPAPGTMVNLSPAYQPVIIRGLTVHKDNPFLFDFIVDVGQDNVQGEVLKKEGERLIKYFLASLAIPDKDAWVNLSPYEKDRMIPQALGQTDMGRDLLEQDYILKQITASLIYPESQLGRNFWDRVYAKAQAMYGTTQVPVNTFNKVWIMADRASVFEHGQTAFVVDQHLKVMLEEDYLALSHHVIPAQAGIQNTHSISSQIIRQIVLPELEHEVNTGKNFANLRQIFNSIILASWYKKNLKEALLNQIYADRSKVSGINLSDPTIKEQIYEQYLKAYKKGVFNYIKEDVNSAGAKSIPRKYFSGGMLAAVANPAQASGSAFDQVQITWDPLKKIEAGMVTTNAAMSAAAPLYAVHSSYIIDRVFKAWLKRPDKEITENEKERLRENLKKYNSNYDKFYQWWHDIATVGTYEAGEFEDTDQLYRFLSQLPGMGEFLVQKARAIDELIQKRRAEADPHKRVKAIFVNLSDFFRQWGALGEDRLTNNYVPAEGVAGIYFKPEGQIGSLQEVSRMLSGVDNPAMTTHSFAQMLSHLPDKYPSPLSWDVLYSRANPYFNAYRYATPEQIHAAVLEILSENIDFSHELLDRIAYKESMLDGFIEEMQEPDEFIEAVKWPETLRKDRENKNAILIRDLNRGIGFNDNYDAEDKVAAILWRLFVLWHKRDEKELTRGIKFPIGPDSIVDFFIGEKGPVYQVWVNDDGSAAQVWKDNKTIGSVGLFNFLRDGGLEFTVEKNQEGHDRVYVENVAAGIVHYINEAMTAPAGQANAAMTVPEVKSRLEEMLVPRLYKRYVKNGIAQGAQRFDYKIANEENYISWSVPGKGRLSISGEGLSFKGKPLVLSFVYGDISANLKVIASSGDYLSQMVLPGGLYGALVKGLSEQLLQKGQWAISPQAVVDAKNQLWQMLDKEVKFTGFDVTQGNYLSWSLPNGGLLTVAGVGLFHSQQPLYIYLESANVWANFTVLASSNNYYDRIYEAKALNNPLLKSLFGQLLVEGQWMDKASAAMMAGLPKGWKEMLVGPQRPVVFSIGDQNYKVAIEDSLAVIRQDRIIIDELDRDQSHNGDGFTVAFDHDSRTWSLKYSPEVSVNQANAAMAALDASYNQRGDTHNFDRHRGDSSTAVLLGNTLQESLAHPQEEDSLGERDGFIFDVLKEHAGKQQQQEAIAALEFLGDDNIEAVTGEGVIRWLYRVMYGVNVTSNISELSAKAPAKSIPNVTADKAMTPGGIDLATSNAMQWKVSKDGQGVEMNIDPAMVAEIREHGLDSLSPVIFRITPVTSVWALMGMQQPQEQLAKA